MLPPNAQTRERALLVASIFLFLAAASALGYARHLSAKRDSRVIEGLTWESAVGAERSISQPSTGYTIVEFGDYECPPCRAQEPRVEALLERSRLPLRRVFRNLPLIAIHPYARPLAVLAEVSREHGQSEPVHRFMFQGPFSPALEERTRERFGLSPQQLTLAERKLAENAVDEDIAEAKRLGIDATPSFLLARPDGRVERTSLERLEGEFLPQRTIDRS